MSTTTATPSPRKNRWVRLAYWLPYLLIAYVLSAGPMYWHIYDAFHGDGSAFVFGFYFPIVSACEYSDYVSNFFHWYAQLWAFSS